MFSLEKKYVVKKFFRKIVFFDVGTSIIILLGSISAVIYSKWFEIDGKLPFLDCLVSHDNNELRTTVYRKPTHTDRLLDESSYNPTSHKATTIKTLTRRAQLVCNTTDSLSDEKQIP